MNKKLCTVLIIVFTVLYVSVNLYMIKPEIKDFGKVISLRVINNISTAKEKAAKVFSRSTKVEYSEVKQSSNIELSKNNKTEIINYKPTEDDIERLYIASKKLSSIDQLKINSYIEGSGHSDVKTAVNLLKDRLSEKEFKKIEQLYLKINQ